MLFTDLCLTPLLIILDPLPYPSDFRHPSSFVVCWSTHPSIIVAHYPLSTFFSSSQNSDNAPNSTSFIEASAPDSKYFTEIVLQ